MDNSEHRLTEMELPLAVICVLFLCVLRGCYPPHPPPSAMDADLLVFVSCHSVGLFCLKKKVYFYFMCVSCLSQYACVLAVYSALGEQKKALEWSYRWS